jgi:YjbE family integral membrane protein
MVANRAIPLPPGRGQIYATWKTRFDKPIFITEFAPIGALSTGPSLPEFSPDWFIALGTVIVIDLVLSGDNAIVIGLAAAGLPPLQRRRAIFYGVIAATVLRILFAVVTFKLLTIIGLTLAGGLLLLWVSWKMWREIRDHGEQLRAVEDAEKNGQAAPVNRDKTFFQALIAIVVADVSMALDNVLGVAGAADEHVEVLIFGLILSIALMAVAANYIARIIERHHWIAYIGLAVIAYVAIDMIYRGINEVAAAV